MKQFIFTWNIENISYSWHLTGTSISSPSFIAHSMQNTVWFLRLQPRGSNIADYLSLYLYRGVDNGPEISVNFELSCICADNSLLHSYTFPESDTSFKNNTGFGHPRFLIRYEVFVEKRALYLPRDVLTLRCRMWKDEGDKRELGQCCGHTQLQIERILSTENINADIKANNIVYIYSQRQNTNLMSINSFPHEDSIVIIINPLYVENIKFSVLKLTFKEKINEKIICNHVSSWLGRPKEEIWRLPALSNILDVGNQNLVENNIELRSEFIYSTGEETKYLEYDNLNLSRLSELVSKYITNYIPTGNISNCLRISQDLWNLHVKRILCDVELKTQTISFFVHKFVLCARSPVFLAMLTGEMKEKRNECIDIEDITDDILEKFVFFLYTDSFENLEWEEVIRLYYSADKYQVKRLKLLCCSYLLKNLNVDNVCEILILADRHYDSDFKREVEDFILENDEKIFSSSTWKNFVYEQSLLAAEIMLLRYDKERGEVSTETYDEKLANYPGVLDDFRSVYQDKIISDIVVKTKSATFPAHKSVLCARSSTLKEIFTQDLKDKSNDVVKIEDLENGIVSRLLLFLYTDSLEDMEWKTAMKLYHAANIYEILQLKIKCSCVLLENLKTSNASDLLLLADQHNDVKLKSLVEDFIVLHDEEIFGSDEWVEFSKTNLLLANETMCSKYRKTRDFF